MMAAMKKSWRLVAISSFLAALLVGGLFGDHLLAFSDDAKDSLRVYTDLVTAAHERYGTEVSYRDLVYASIQGMLRSLDPHTSFLSPEAYSSMRDRQRETFYGLGILVGVRDGHLPELSVCLDQADAAPVGVFWHDEAGDALQRGLVVERTGQDERSIRQEAAYAGRAAYSAPGCGASRSSRSKERASAGGRGTQASARPGNGCGYPRRVAGKDRSNLNECVWFLL